VSVRTLHGDCLTVLPTLGPVDAIVTDPPYHLLTTVKRFGQPNSALPTSAVHGRVARGFMGQQWDGGDIAFRPETWATIGAALKPGGYLLAFGGTRTWHRMACAIEDAGFVIQDTIAWVYGSGFPKNKTLLKPAFEPIVMAYKPGGKRELQIDECRIAANGETFGNADEYAARSRKKNEGWVRPHHGGQDDQERARQAIMKAETLGRWPANLCHDGSDGVLALFPQTKGGQSREDRGIGGMWAAGNGVPCGPQYGDTGSASRFFFSAKAGAEDRWGSRHPTVKPVALMKWLVQLVTPLRGIVLDPFAGSGTTGVAALAADRNAILIERESNWFADIQERIAFYEGEGRHSLQAKARRIATPRGAMPLFEAPA